MIHIIKKYKWVIATSLICILFGILTFFTFINQSSIELKDSNLQTLLVADLILLLIFFTVNIRESYKILKERSNKKLGSETSSRYFIFFTVTTLLPSILIAILSLVLFNVGLQKYFDKKITSAVNNSYEVAKNYIEETKRSVEADIFLVGIDLNRFSGILFSNPQRVQSSINTQKNLRRLDEIYLIDSDGTILLGETNNPDDQFLLPTEDEFDSALSGKPVAINVGSENKTAFILKLNNFKI